MIKNRIENVLEVCIPRMYKTQYKTAIVKKSEVFLFYIKNYIFYIYIAVPVHIVAHKSRCMG